MKRFVILSVAFLVALVPLASAQAGQVDPEAIERIVTDLENVMGRIEGVDFKALNVRSHANGLYSVSIPIPEATRERLLASSASDFKALAVGLQLTDPSSFSALITAVDCNPNTTYNHWFAVANLRNSDQFKKTTFQAKGPGKFKIVDNFVYDAAAFSLFFVDVTTGGFGFRTIQVKITTAGKAKSIVLCN